MISGMIARVGADGGDSTKQHGGSKYVDAADVLFVPECRNGSMGSLLVVLLVCKILPDDNLSVRQKTA